MARRKTTTEAKPKAKARPMSAPAVAAPEEAAGQAAFSAGFPIVGLGASAGVPRGGNKG